MYNKRYNEHYVSNSTVSKELRAIKDNELEKDMEHEILLKRAIEESFNGKFYNSLKKILLKLTKAS